MNEVIGKLGEELSKSFTRQTTQQEDENNFKENRQRDHHYYVNRPNFPVLTTVESSLFDCIEKDDLATFKKIHKKSPDVNINCRNILGYTPLLQSIRAGKISFVRYLISLPKLALQDALLHTIKKTNISMFMIVYNKQIERGPLTFNPDYSDFPMHMTPMMLAAQVGEYTMLQNLAMNYKISKPHKPTCFCKEFCSQRAEAEELELSITRLLNYRSIASPCYICLNETDPILSSFITSEELTEYSKSEIHFQFEYIELRDQVETFLSDIISEVRTDEEMALVLFQTEGYSRYKKGDKYARLMLAIQEEHMKFLVNSNVQQFLTLNWLGTYHEWKSYGPINTVMEMLYRIVFLPGLFILMNIAPEMNYCKKMNMPVNKFLNFVASYLTFIVLLYIMNELDVLDPRRGPPSTGLEVFIIIYVFGLAFKTYTEYQIKGYWYYFQDPWNVFIVIEISMFFLTFLTWAIADIDLTLHGKVHLPRGQWGPYDINLFSEAFFSIAYILSFGPLLLFMQLTSTFGPLQLALMNMVGDIFKFMGIFTWASIAFGAGLYSIYHHYDGMEMVENGEVIRQNEAFYSMENSLSSMYWSIYGYAPPSITRIILPKIAITENNHTKFVSNPHLLTETVGHLILLIFYIVCIITLINMLIAMMANSFSNVQSNSDQAFKFNRFKMWSPYFGDGSSLPPPYNLFPSLKFITKFFYKHWPSNSKKDARTLLMEKHAIARTKRQEKEDSEFNDSEYKIMMNNLIQRYLSNPVRTVSDEQRIAQMIDIKRKVTELNKKYKITRIQNKLSELDDQEELLILEEKEEECEVINEITKKKLMYERQNIRQYMKKRRNKFSDKLDNIQYGDTKLSDLQNSKNDQWRSILKKVDRNDYIPIKTMGSTLISDNVEVDRTKSDAALEIDKMTVSKSNLIKDAVEKRKLKMPVLQESTREGRRRRNTGSSIIEPIEI